MSENREHTDSGRLDALEKSINTWGGLVLYTGEYPLPENSRYPGLGLRPGSLIHTLRKAIDGSLLR